MLRARRNLKEFTFIVLLIFLLSCFKGISGSTYAIKSGHGDVGPILHAWCWKFSDVTRHMHEIADAGYKSVQVSPIQKEKKTQEDYNGQEKLLSSWWALYQPLNFEIGNCLGTRDDFKFMCRKAHELGIKIIVDVVANHLANGGDATTYSSDIDKKLLSIKDLFHLEGFEEGYPFENRFCATQKSIGMPDLNTSNKEVQEIIIKFLHDAIDCGADGFRFDAARHIELPKEYDGEFGSDFWPTIVDAIKKKKPECYIYGETLSDNCTNLSAYQKYMDVTDSKMGDSVFDSIMSGNIDSLRVDYCGQEDEGSFITWVESHDTYAQDGCGPTMRMPFYKIKLGWAIVASRKKSIPLYLARPSSDQLSFGGKEIMTGKMGGCGDLDWKDRIITQINRFNVMMKNEEEIIRRYGNSVYVTERGNKGAVIVNVGDEYRRIFGMDTGLPDGSYTGDNYEFRVESHKLTGYIHGNTVAVVYCCDVPDVFISQHGGNYSDELHLRLGNVNTYKSTYSVDGSEEKKFDNGAYLVIGKDKKVGEDTVVKISGFAKDEEKIERTYVFTKCSGENSLMIEVDRSGVGGWHNSFVYAYSDTHRMGVSNGENKMEIAPWPGWPMSLSEDGSRFICSLKVRGEWRVMVSDGGGNQFPTRLSPGVLVKTNEKLKFCGPCDYKLLSPM